MTFEPALLLAMWAAGLAAAAAAVAWWGVARTGYLWLAGAVAAVVGIVAAAAEPLGILAVALAGAGAALARLSRPAALAFAASAVSFLAVAAGLDGWVPATIGSLALGGITGEMLLGHWYLVDPRLPRWSLRRLAAAGAAGVVGEVVVALSRGSIASPTGLFGAAYLMLAVVTLLLVAGVWFSLKEKGYEGVMAATGLSYLATLTVLAVAFLGRAPLEDLLS